MPVAEAALNASATIRADASAIASAAVGGTLSLPVTDNATMRQRLPRSPVHKPLSLHSECDNTSDNRMPAQRREPLLSLPRTLDEVDYVVGVDTHSFRTHSSITQNSR